LDKVRFFTKLFLSADIIGYFFHEETVANSHFVDRCHIPEPAQLTDEQLAKLTEKKKEKKQRQKEKIKIKKEAEKKEAEELAARAAFLAMSDREKRAAAAEARLARLEGGPRCIQCGVVYTGSGFEYMELKFCSPSCVASHRRGLVQT
ncbi:hypothetical protein COOONC_18685, partial [Cooperia oncophora]